jgi:anti-anti-sigma factor
MNIQIYNSGIFRVLKINGQIMISDLHEIKHLIEGYIEHNDKYIAVNFCETSYLFSGAVAVLVSCYKLLRDRSGELCLMEPKPEILDLLKMMGIDSLMPIFGSDIELPTDIRQLEMTSIADFRG